MCTISNRDTIVISHMLPPAHGTGYYLVGLHYPVRRFENSLSVILSTISNSRARDHPHLPQILGVSDYLSKTPFVVFNTSMSQAYQTYLTQPLISFLSPAHAHLRIRCRISI